VWFFVLAHRNWISVGLSGIIIAFEGIDSQDLDFLFFVQDIELVVFTGSRFLFFVWKHHLKRCLLNFIITSLTFLFFSFADYFFYCIECSAVKGFIELFGWWIEA